MSSIKREEFNKNIPVTDAPERENPATLLFLLVEKRVFHSELGAIGRSECCENGLMTFPVYGLGPD
jgi:hypothetical protein